MNLEQIKSMENEISNKRNELQKVKQAFTLRGAKVAVNKIYNDLYKEKIPQTEKIEQFWNRVEDLKNEYVGDGEQ